MRQKLQIGKRRPHGLYGTPTYISYREMLKRCYDVSVIRYPNYGGRGITVCDSWRSSILNFVEDMGLRPSKKHSIDRIDVNGPYCKENCKWSTVSEQMNNRTNTLYVTAFGKTQSVMSWSKETGIPGKIIRQRLTRDKMTPEEALSNYK